MSNLVRHPSGAAMRKDPDTGVLWAETQSDEEKIIKWEQDAMSDRMSELWGDADELSDALCDVTDSIRLADLISSLKAQNHENIGKNLTLIINDYFAVKAAKELKL